MESPKKSLGIFLHFSKLEYIPYYVLLFLRELNKHMDEVMFVSNKRIINNEEELQKEGIRTLFVKNEGYDLGMFYKAFQTINPDNYRQIACVNDSNILINSLKSVFEWGENQHVDLWGLIDSYQKPWFSIHQNNYHIQSHFLVFNQKAIDQLPVFFKEIDVERLFEEKDPAQLRRTVINDWEIGLTQFLIDHGLTCKSFIDSQAFSQLYLSGKIKNVGHKLYAELIYSGYPLLKKKVILRHDWRDHFRIRKSWEKLIRKYGNQDWEIEALIQELIKMKRKS